MKDMSKVSVIVGGYTLKTLQSATFTLEGNKEMDDPDLYGNSENIVTKNAKATLEVVVKKNLDDDLFLTNADILCTEIPVFYKDKTGDKTFTATCIKSMVKAGGRTNNNSENTVTYTINMPVTKRVMI